MKIRIVKVEWEPGRDDFLGRKCYFSLKDYCNLLVKEKILHRHGEEYGQMMQYFYRDYYKGWANNRVDNLSRIDYIQLSFSDIRIYCSHINKIVGVLPDKILSHPFVKELNRKIDHMVAHPIWDNWDHDLISTDKVFFSKYFELQILRSLEKISLHYEN
jgi:hypothetical protein